MLSQTFEGRAHARSRYDLVALAAERNAKDLAEPGLVVDDKDLGGAGRDCGGHLRHITTGAFFLAFVALETV